MVVVVVVVVMNGAGRFVSTYLLYFGYMALLSLGLGLITGSVGVLTTFWFVRKIYSIVKVD